MASRENLGCYDPSFEHDACGVAFVADLHRPASHRVVGLGLTALENLAHRGAFGADPGTGDGAGALIQIPDGLFREVAGFELPAPGHYATGMAFLPAEARPKERAVEVVGAIARSEGLRVLGWREVPVDLSVIGDGARRSAPCFSQVFLADCQRPGPVRRCPRAPVLHRAKARRARRCGRLLPVFVDADLRLQGHARPRPAAGLLRGSSRRAAREPNLPGPLALFDQHLPLLAARSPLPAHRPQRRDQHPRRATGTGCGPARPSWPASTSKAT